MSTIVEQTEGLEVTKIKNEEIDFTSQKDTTGLETCPKCGRMAMVEEGQDYTHYQHIIVKSYRNDRLVNINPRFECLILK